MRLIRSIATCAALLAVGASTAQAQRVNFGSALAVGDGEVFVGEPGNSYRPGTVYVYRKTGGAWERAAALTGANAEIDDGFGGALTLSGGFLFVSVGGGGGAVEVFGKEGGEWMSTGTRLTPSASAADPSGPPSAFGLALAASGDWLFVSDPMDDRQLGAVYAFKRGADGSWMEAAKLAPTDTMARGGLFGASLAVEDGVLLVGAPRGTMPAPPAPPQAPPGFQPPTPPERTGVVHAFEFDSEAGSWKHADMFSSRTLGANAGFGGVIAMSNGAALVSVTRTLVFLPSGMAVGAGGSGYGGVHIFRRNPQSGRWGESSRLGAFNSTPGDGFGRSVAVAGNEVWVGSPGASISSGGGAYVYAAAEPNAPFNSVRTMAPSNVGDGDGFGGKMAIGGDVLVAGAGGTDYGQGSVFIYERDGSGEWRSSGPHIGPNDEMPAMAGEERKCGDEGKVELFACKDVELLAYLPASKVTIDGGRGVRFNDIWGWTDSESGREYALLGRTNGVSVVDVTEPTNPRLVADLPAPAGTRHTSWRDIKVYKDHAFVVADNSPNHGVQVFDLRKVREVGDAPGTFEMTAHYKNVSSVHNIVINEETGFAYSVGSGGGGETCGGGLHMIDIRDPANPTFAGCFADAETGRAKTGYSHDAQCVVYRGPDERYQGRELCLGSNETHLSIADVTDKKAPKAVSRVSYPDFAYTHQGWLSEDHRYFLMNDELDELRNMVDSTRTLIWDLADLENPFLVKQFMGPTEATDHNTYIVGNLAFQSHYMAGLRILDVSDPTSPAEVAYFDTAPYSPDTKGFAGSWSNYPFFKSGTIIVSGIGEGLFILKMRNRKPVT